MSNTIPAHPSLTINIAFHLIPIPCHFETNHLITITYRSTIQGQEEHQDETHSRLAPRLGLRASPRRESFAQASSLRLGESSRIWNNGLYTFSLGRDSPRLSETLACSKLSESPGRPFAREGLGEPLLTSPRQDKLAWARLSVATTVLNHRPGC
ncbi:hypothetical protein DEO72_LG5g1436 [Vigna unguiculata]|uniref:Uncharacterized protein n=1 Tax=Vigna unguiculata TaxID=3917 RepID=A0A4D6LYD5_VIGUN|nr:hypothetical protein DEO72_LG5g1436 [Vigna unguiculata]